MTNKCVEILVGFIDVFLDFPQHVSANNCHHQGESKCFGSYSGKICIVDVYGLRFVQCG
jgi:hypothetical protein